MTRASRRGGARSAADGGAPTLLALAAASSLGVAGCAEVVFDRDEEPSSSSASGSASDGPTSISSSGVGGAGATSGDASTGLPAGAGGAGGDGGGGGEVEPIPPCPELAWLGEPLIQDLHEDAFEAGDLLLEPTAFDDDGAPGLPDSIRVLASYPERDGDVITRNVRFMHAGNAWTVAGADVDPAGAYLTYDGVAEWSSLTSVPTPIITGRGGSPAFVVESTSQGFVRELIDGGGAALPAGAFDVRTMAWSDQGFYAIVHGPAERPRIDLVAPDLPGEVVPTEVAPCADRPVALEVAAVGERFLVASADGGPCDRAAAPRVVLLSRLDAHGDTLSTTVLDAGGVVTGLQIHGADDHAWVAVRTEESPTVRLVRFPLTGPVTAVGEVPLGAGRELALATRGDELVLVDGGPPSDDAPSIRIRTFDRDLRPIATSPPLVEHTLDPRRAPEVLVRDDQGGVAVATFHQVAADHLAVVLLRAVCVEGGER